MNAGENPVALLVVLYAEKVKSGASDEALATVMARVHRQVAYENESYAEDLTRVQTAINSREADA